MTQHGASSAVDTHSVSEICFYGHVGLAGIQVRSSKSASEETMSSSSEAWNGEVVREWLKSRVEAARLDQAEADRRGFQAQDDYDKAAAEEWVCGRLSADKCTDHQTAFAQRVKELLGQDEFKTTGVNDDGLFDRHARAYLRKLTKMTKANNGFANRFRYQ
jgi:hypothetical protein